MDSPVWGAALVFGVFVGGMYAYERWKDWVRVETYERFWGWFWLVFIVLWISASIYHYLRTGQVVLLPPLGGEHRGP